MYFEDQIKIALFEQKKFKANHQSKIEKTDYESYKKNGKLNVDQLIKIHEFFL